MDSDIIKIEGQGTNITGGTRSAQLGNTDFVVDPETGKSTVVATGTSFSVLPFPIRSGDPAKSVTVIIIGNETAGKLTLKVNVQPPPGNNLGNTYGLPPGFSMGN